MKKNLIFLTLFFLTVPSHGLAFSSSGFRAPESMQVDPEDGAYYITNVNEDPFEKDGNGFISKVSANGNTIIQKYIGGKTDGPTLHAPKGLVVSGSQLFVADLDAVKVLDKATGKLIRTVDLLPFGGKFTCDIAQDAQGVLYVSDMLANKIFKIDPRNEYAVSVFKEGESLGQPNGLMINPRTRNLMVTTWKSGEILEIDASGRVHRLKRGLTTLHGIDYDVEGNIYVSSFEKGEIYRIPFYGRGPLSVFLSGLTTPADISCDRKKYELLIPSSVGDSVSTSPIHVKRSEELKSAAGSEKKPPDQGKNRQ